MKLLFILTILVLASSCLPSVDNKSLATLSLPTNANKQDVRDYINLVYANIETRGGTTSDDLEVRKLIEVGSGNVDMLLEVLTVPKRRDWIYARHALAKLVNESHKDLIVSSLATKKVLSYIVYDRGWHNDAKDTLLKVLKERPRDFNSGWLECVAKVADRNSFQDLRWHLLNGRGRLRAHTAMITIKGLDLTNEVNSLWKGAQSRFEPYAIRDIAKIALYYGHIDALGYLVTYYNSPDADDYEKMRIEIDLKRYFQDDVLREVFKNYNKYKDLLMFDVVLKTYKL